MLKRCVDIRLDGYAVKGENEVLAVDWIDVVDVRLDRCAAKGENEVLAIEYTIAPLGLLL